MNEKDEVVLKETAKLRDIVSLDLCMKLYPICNDKIIGALTGLDFSNLLNLNKTAQEVIVLSKQKVKVCYLADCIMKIITPQTLKKVWLELFLKRCNIPVEYYKSHYRDICKEGTKFEKEEFKKSVNFAIFGVEEIK